MTLGEKLYSIPRNKILEELHTLLSNEVTLTISWNGRRLMQIVNYEGVIKIDQLAIVYLSAQPFDPNESSTLKERLDCCELWERIRKLYEKSEEKMQKTRILKHLFPSYDDVTFENPMPMLTICDEGGMGYKTKNSIFAFTEDEFEKIWPNAKKMPMDNGKLWASKEMIEEAMKKSS